MAAALNRLQQGGMAERRRVALELQVVFVHVDARRRIDGEDELEIDPGGLSLPLRRRLPRGDTRREAEQGGDDPGCNEGGEAHVLDSVIPTGFCGEFVEESVCGPF